ncbi:MAG: type 1 glutamine amidotransferase domain-containing protein [Phycisphaerales bacterium JB063]
MPDISGKRILIFLGDDYEDMELQYPKYRLREAGCDVVVAGIEAGVTHKGKHGYPQVSEAKLADLDAKDFDGLVVPGGWMPDKLRRYDEVKRLTADIDAQGKMLGSICHGAWINISANVVKGYRYTSTPGIKDDLLNAGVSTWVDEETVVDRHHVSARKPDDCPAFCKAMIEVLAKQ